VVDDLYAARGELFDDLFTRAWALLDEAARRVLLVATFFPADASASALSATADVQAFAFARAVERLVDLALFDVQQGELNSVPRYTQHPLVSAFARARLAEQEWFEQLARDRWVEWYAQLTARVGYCWSDLARFTLLDQEYETVLYVLKWAFQKGKYREVVQIARDIDYYYYMRGLWAYSLEKNLLGAEAARRIGNDIGEVFGLWNYVILCSRQGNTLEAESHLPRLHELTQSPGLSRSDQHDIQHALAVYWHAQESVDAAERIWLSMLAQSEQLSPVLQVEARYWLGLCRYQNKAIISAEQLLQDASQLAQKYGYVQGVISTQMRLIQIDLDQGRLDKAEYALEEILSRASDYRRRIADIQYLNFRLHTLRGDLLAARCALTEAIDLLERLGMRRELTEAREELARLETTIASASEPTPA
jgi:tetratricopeptide (TPR) repeat protein